MGSARGWHSSVILYCHWARTASAVGLGDDGRMITRLQILGGLPMEAPAALGLLG
jgi:hypothetical protein